MILTDDNFATIVKAVELGRGLYDNLTKYIRFQMGVLFGLVFTFLGAAIFNIVGGARVPAAADAVAELHDAGVPGGRARLRRAWPGLMERKPRDPQTPILPRSKLLWLAFVGGVMACRHARRDLLGRRPLRHDDRAHDGDDLVRDREPLLLVRERDERELGLQPRRAPRPEVPHVLRHVGARDHPRAADGPAEPDPRHGAADAAPVADLHRRRARGRRGDRDPQARAAAQGGGPPTQTPSRRSARGGLRAVEHHPDRTMAPSRRCGRLRPCGSRDCDKLPPPLSRGRRILVWTLVVLATVLALVSILTTWVNRQMLDNTAWNKATTQAIQDPQVQSAIATYAVNELYANVNIGQAFADRLARRLKPLAAPLAGALEAPSTRACSGSSAAARPAALHQRQHDRAPEARQRPREQDQLRHLDGQRRGHAQPVRHDLRDRDRARYPVRRAGEAADRLGTVTLLKSSQLQRRRPACRPLKVLSDWLLVGVLFLYGLAIYLARARGAPRCATRGSGS